MFRILNISKSFDGIRAVNDFSFEWKAHKIVGLIGPNGAGKTSLFNIIIRFLSADLGQCFFKNKNVKQGISLIPQGSQVFGEMTVMENPEIASFILKDKKMIKQRFEEAFQRFPLLKERRKQSTGKLSGGEQQMLALRMALLQRPRLLLMDEPSLCLSPMFVK